MLTGCVSTSESCTPQCVSAAIHTSVMHHPCVISVSLSASPTASSSIIYIHFGGAPPPQSRLSSAVGFMETAISFECLQTVQIYFTPSWLAQCSVKQYRCPRSRRVCPAHAYGSHPLYLKSVICFVSPLCGNQIRTGCVNCFYFNFLTPRPQFWKENTKLLQVSVEDKHASFL